MPPTDPPAKASEDLRLAKVVQDLGNAGGRMCRDIELAFQQFARDLVDASKPWIRVVESLKRGTKADDAD